MADQQQQEQQPKPQHYTPRPYDPDAASIVSAPLPHGHYDIMASSSSNGGSSHGGSGAATPTNQKHHHGVSAQHHGHRHHHGSGSGTPEAARSRDDLEIEDDDGGARTSSQGSVKDAAAAAPVVDSEHKDSFLSFLKSILGKDVDSMRVSVPLWLLEPVSNLEYLAELDYLEYLVDAPRHADPVARMVSIVSMLLASLKKATKKAKKPINPVLGEVFFSHFDTTKSTGNPSADAEAVSAHVVSSSDADRPPVLLVGEQVSHHPPISAFYAACPATGIDVTLLYDVKAKFNGLSFSLINDSIAVVRIPSLDEVYDIEYPNANLVGVLTMSFRLMWSGACTITCKKTGLQTSITFKEKRWFGRDTYDLTGTIHKIGSPKTPLATISGAWNAATHITYAGRSSGSSTPVLLFDAASESPYNFHVAPPTVTPANASRNVWGETMQHMVVGDAGAATRTKTVIEERQREIERARTRGDAPAFQPMWFEYHPEVAKGTNDGRKIRYTGGAIPTRGADVREHLPQPGVKADGLGNRLDD
ncbi:hypothetical protein BC828DRAFT_238077 [Blastocladiella britannica]|nr:hypothetical protein BC828DRAFT_238077 [Blastocladiella britannica]